MSNGSHRLPENAIGQHYLLDYRVRGFGRRRISREQTYLAKYVLEALGHLGDLLQPDENFLGKILMSHKRMMK
jgi:hypothetical protein